MIFSSFAASRDPKSQLFFQKLGIGRLGIE